MVVHDLDVFRTLHSPAKTDAELIVDAHAVLSAAIAMQGFEPVSGRRSQIA
jgi:hypothetical protein